MDGIIKVLREEVEESINPLSPPSGIGINGNNKSPQNTMIKNPKLFWASL